MRIIYTIFGISLACVELVTAQNARIDWYTFDAGFNRGRLGEGGTVIGQSLVARIANSAYQIESGFAVYDTIKGVISEVSHQASIPHDFQLYQNFPNPFNPRTSIQYDLPYSSYVSLKIYDVLGRIVAIPVDEVREHGRHASVFDARTLSSGIYIYQLTAMGNQGERFISRRKMLLLK